MNQVLAQLAKSSAFASKLEAQGLVAEAPNLSGLATSMKQERDAYASFIKRNNITASD
jgi:hypothetical protein